MRGPRAAKKGLATKAGKIDFSDIPELSGEQLSAMRRVGRPPVGDAPRKAVSIRLDQNVLAWLKRTAAERQQPYQSLINDILRRAMRRSA